MPDPIHTKASIGPRPGKQSPVALEYESVTPALSDSDLLNDDPAYFGMKLTAWIKIGMVTVLMILTFRYNLVRLWGKTNPFNGEPNWRHAICVPLIGLYYLYVNRDEVLSAPVKTSWSGLGILLLGFFIFVYGIYPGQNDFVKDFGMIVSLFGVVAMLAGWQVLKVTWFPIVFLICAIPWPELVYSKVAWPLQRLAASVAVGTLRYTGVDAFNTGTKIMISRPGQADRTLNVAEACAGLRSLMTFISVAAAVAFLSVRVLWQKLVITASAIPIAVFCNVMRVSGQGLLDRYVSQELAEGFAHQFVGIIMLVPGFFLILLTGWVLDKLFIEEADRKKSNRHIVHVGSAKPVEWNVPGQQVRTKETRAGIAGAAASSTAPRPRQPAIRPTAAAAAATRATPNGVSLHRPNGAVPKSTTAGAAVTPPRPGQSPAPRRSTVLSGNSSSRVPPKPVARSVAGTPAPPSNGSSNGRV